MIKKIVIDELRVGMYVQELGSHWLNHPFLRNQFMIKDDKMVQKIIGSGIREVCIDTSKGLDTIDLPPKEKPSLDRLDPTPTATPSQVPVSEESSRAKVLFRDATQVIRTIMQDARLGRQVEIQALDPLAERVVQSTLRSNHAFSGISRIKTKDEYTFMHSVSVAGLMTAFGVEMGLDNEMLHQIAIGGMVHDIGKTLIPDAILNKPGKLEDDEFTVMKRHVEHGKQLLTDLTDLSQTALDMTLQHHERMDGRGYPLGLKGEQISLIGQMASIVDVYDALTSVRVYKQAWEPAVTLKSLLQWCPNQFNRTLVERFIKCLGIFPVGSLVELESGRVGIVIEQGEDSLKPRLKIIYNTRLQGYVRVTELDLARVGEDKIKSVRSPAELGIELSDFI